MQNLHNSAGWDSAGTIARMLEQVKIPAMARIEQELESEKIIDLKQVLSKELHKAEIRGRIKAGMSIAITVGSRGIAEIADIVKFLVKELKAMQTHPFIVPAMGSHGGATAEGQRELIEGFGLTEEYIDAPIRATMDTVRIGLTPGGKEVHIDAYAAKADGIVVLGRVKPHPAFRGRYESGLMKMMAIGLGKQRGAQICHADGFVKMAEYVPEFGEVVIEKAPILCGIAVIENGLDEVHSIEAISPPNIVHREPQLLELARELMAGIPFPEIDVLIVDRIGKNISGDGMDPNVTGSFATPYQYGGPEVKRYVVLDITEESHGNGLGLGMADFSTSRVFAKIKLDIMYANSITSTVPGPSKLPLIMRNDILAIKAGIHTANIPGDRPAKIVRISDTGHLQRMWVSEALRDEAESQSSIRMISDFIPPSFDTEGNLLDAGIE